MSRNEPLYRCTQSMKKKEEERKRGRGASVGDHGKGPGHGGRRHWEGGRTNEARPLGMRHKEGGRAVGKEARSRPGAGCRKQGQGVRTQDLQTQPGPKDPIRREGTKTLGKK